MIHLNLVFDILGVLLTLMLKFQHICTPSFITALGFFPPSL